MRKNRNIRYHTFRLIVQNVDALVEFGYFGRLEVLFKSCEGDHKPLDGVLTHILESLKNVPSVITQQKPEFQSFFDETGSLEL